MPLHTAICAASRLGCFSLNKAHNVSFVQVKIRACRCSNTRASTCLRMASRLHGLSEQVSYACVLTSWRVLSLTVSLRKARVDGVRDGGGLCNLALPLALPNIVEYLCSCVVSPARNMTTHAVPTCGWAPPALRRILHAKTLQNT
jgi:hypothetical protein